MKTSKKQMILNRGGIILLAVALLGLCVANGLLGGVNADFIPINGDFQNYNVVRRFLDGQTPFQDFAAYLGYGHLVLGSLANLLFGWKGITLTTSKMAFQFLSLFSLAMISLLIFSCSAKAKKNRGIVALIFANLILVMVVADSSANILSILPEDLYQALHSALTAGNSARFLRGLAPVLFVALVLVLQKILQKCRLKATSPWYYPILLGIPVGGFIFYSNDYGLASSVCGVIYFITVTLFSKKNLVRKVREGITFLLIVLATFLITGTLITRGHITDYISATFGTGGMQAWYYNVSKSHYLYNIDWSIFTLVQGAVAAVYFCLFIKNLEKEDKRYHYGVMGFMNMTAYAAENEYKLLSGGTLHEVAYTILLLTGVAELFRAVVPKVSQKIRWSYGKMAVPVAATAALSVACSCWLIKDYLTSVQDHSNDIYVENVGYLSELGPAILATDEFLKQDDRVFSTYATALETYREQYQPSGYDYIIHVLGDEAMENYMEVFRQGEFEYVTTIREEYLVFEYWVRNANWYFYREMYANYIPAYANDYQLFWKKREQPLEPLTDAQVSVEYIEDFYCKLWVEAPGVEYGVADVKLSYQVEEIPGIMALLDFAPMLHLEDVHGAPNLEYGFPGDWYYLKPEGDGIHIGVPVVNGVGEIRLKSEPTDDTVLANVEAELEAVYATGTVAYGIVLDAVETEMGITLEIANTARNRIITENAEQISIEDITVPVEFSLDQENNRICIEITRENCSDGVKEALIGHGYYPVIQIIG